MNMQLNYEKTVQDFRAYLTDSEKSPATIQKYLRVMQKFTEYAGKRELDRTLILSYKESLRASHSPTGANAILAAVNAFLRFVGRTELCVRAFRVQKKAFCAENRELCRAEYVRLVRAAQEQKNERLSLLIETVCGTGIRISELSFITAEALEHGEVTVFCKGKTRTVFLVPALRKKLRSYAKRRGIAHGALFTTRSGKPLNRSNIWKEMKSLCDAAHVSPQKVFPHNLRHLFARTFYAIDRDLAKLADLLGHSSVNTTRIYIVTTGEEHRRRMETMRLIL